MKIGVVLPIAQEDADGRIVPYATLRSMALAAGAAGFDSVWVFDHLLFRDDDETNGIHECWTILSATADATRRVELGTLVMCTGFRNAALLAKMAATLDHVSGGRLILGIGAVGVTIRYPEADPGADAEAPSGKALSGTADEIAAGLRAHAQAGADHFIASLDPCTERAVAEFAEAVAVVRAG